MSKYTLEIDFGNKGDGRHCLICPIINRENDGCPMQKTGKYETEFEDWEKQMENCPLKLIKS